ncbi:MAG: RluA family pseudouridine synthase [Gammaproteobacteria bacterium]|nr:RluA family pseudouridine synthase [Gammaproteobacteria bacterium]
MTTSRTHTAKNRRSDTDSSQNDDLNSQGRPKSQNSKDTPRQRTTHAPSRRAPSSYPADARRSEAFKLKKRPQQHTEGNKTANSDEARLEAGIQANERASGSRRERTQDPRTKNDSRNNRSSHDGNKSQLRSRSGAFLNRNQQRQHENRPRIDTRSKPAAAYQVEEDPEDAIFGSETAFYWQYQPVDTTPEVEELSENGTPKPKAAFVPAQTTTPQVTWYTVDEDHDGQRLDNFLVARLKGVPKTRIYRLIRESQVRINKGRVKADTRIKTGDLIRVAPIRMREIGAAPVIGQELADSLRERIVYEDEGLIVLNKPAGLAVHGGSGVDFGVIEAIRQTLGKPYLELVHRLDRETSGLLMIAKKRSTLKVLQDYLREGKIRKTYLALVKGVVALDKQRIDVPLAKVDLPSGERRVRVAADGKESQTDFVVIERFAHATLVEASPLTGRTHQIRVHGLSINHPLLGDDKYGHERAYHGAEARRLCLHAVRLTVPGYPVFETPQPDDFVVLIEKLRKEVKGRGA